MGHDQLFKDFLRAFLQECLELVYPELAERLDFKTLRLLDKELFTDFPEGTTREADLVAEIETRDGSPRLVVIHIEVQLRTKPDFPERMYRYFTMLWLRHAVPIVPIVLYLRGGREGVAVHQYMMHSFELEQVRFRYRSVALARLEAQSYVASGNAVAAALAALMNRRDTKDTLTLRAVMFQRVAESVLDDARKLLLSACAPSPKGDGFGRRLKSAWSCRNSLFAYLETIVVLGHVTLKLYLLRYHLIRHIARRRHKVTTGPKVPTPELLADRPKVAHQTM